MVRVCARVVGMSGPMLQSDSKLRESTKLLNLANSLDIEWIRMPPTKHGLTNLHVEVIDNDIWQQEQQIAFEPVSILV